MEPPPRTTSERSLTPLGTAVVESATAVRHLMLVAIPVGALVGTAIAAYDWIVNELLWGHIAQRSLPVRILAPAVGMTLAGLLLRMFRVRSSAMADEVVNAYHDPDVRMPVDTAFGKLTASIATMGFGASAGMEGASKWLGATIGYAVQKRLNRWSWRAAHGNPRTALLVGGSAGIAAIFRAPLSGAIMGVESPYKHDLAHEALLPALAASATSFWAFTRLRPATSYFPISFHYQLTARDMLVAVPLGLSAGLASHLFLGTLARCRRWSETRVRWLPLRTALGGVLLAGLAYASYRIVGAPVTLHAGLPVANDLLNGRYVLSACVIIFALKLVATSLTFGSGGVGGLFVPTATIGAALGASWDALVPGQQPGVYTLLGIAAFAGASYNSLLFSTVFIAEATGSAFLMVPALIASTISFLVAAGVSNSRAQKPHRVDPDDALEAVPVTRVMTTRIVTVGPEQPLDAFARSVLLTDHFKALPVIDGQGTLLGMIGVQQLREVPMHDWSHVLVGQIMDERPRVLCAHHSAADAKQLLQRDGRDYVPVVDPRTYQLVGIVSGTDIHRAHRGIDGGSPATPRAPTLPS
jgi:chloride channel protein, CIC family